VKQRLMFQISSGGVVALVAAAVLGAWAATRVAGNPGLGQRRREPTRSEAAHRSRAEVGSRPETTGADARARRSADNLSPTPVHEEVAIAPSATAGTNADAGEAQASEQRLAADMKRLVRDLEFNAGLPEPIQQTVVPPPPPWRPESGTESQEPPVIDDVVPRGAPSSGGVRVTIRGKNLRASRVMFGLSEARIVSVSPDAVTVVAPGGDAGPVRIAVTNDDGSYAVARAPFTYGK
jgi:hypothetical protein